MFVEDVRRLKQKTEVKQIVNEAIRAPKVQLIGADGENVGIVSRHEALAMARDASLDLVQLAEQGSMGVPVVKILDFGKALYAKKKKSAEAKKHQKVIQIKEIKIRPKIGEHDLETKINQAAQFLRDGMHLKVTLVFRGREMITSEERGNQLFEKVDQMLQAHDLEGVTHEKDMRAGPMWSRMYLLKSAK